MKKTSLSAKKLRTLLAFGLVLALIGGIVGFYYASKVLRAYAVETSALNGQAVASDDNVETLKQIQKYLDEHADDVARADKVVASSKQYQYQDEIFRDISSFANKSGVGISGFNFSGADSNGGGGAASTTAPPAGSSATGGAIPAAGGSLNSTSITVNVDSPVNYKKLLAFIHYIETSPTRMQIASVSLSGSGSSNVTTEAFNIKVYIQ